MNPATGATQSAAAPAPDQAIRSEGWAFGLAILLAAVNLRPAVASVGPVLADIRAGLALSAASASLLMALPILCFGAGALVAPRLARRLGSERTLTAVLGITTAGLLLRLGPNPVTLLTGTFLAGAAIAVANVLIPAMVKRHFPQRTGLMMGLYVCVMAIAASCAAILTVPVAEAFASGWRAGLGVWALPSALAFVLWLAVTSSRRRRSVPDDRTTEVPRSLAGDWVAWQVTAFMGLQSLGFYTMLSWLPSVYRSYGMSPEDAGRLLSLMIILGAPIALVVPTMLTRAAQQSGWALGSVLTIASGVLGLLLAPTWHPFLWATVLGIGLGVAFPLALTLVVLRSRDASDAAQLSAMSQSVGYGMAAIGPFVFGLLRDLTAGWTVPVLFLLVLLVPQAIAGVGAGRAAFVGDGGGR